MKVTLSCSKIKKIARQMVGGNWAKGFLVVFISIVLAGAPAVLAYYLSRSLAVSYFVDLYTLFVTGPITYGVTNFFLDVFRKRQEPGIGSFTAGLPYILNAVVLYFLELVLVFLWSLLLVVPGIIAAIRYSQAFFVLADNPGMNAFECLRISKQLMQQNKGKFFALQLSFMPWLLLSVLPGSLMQAQYMGFSATWSMEQIAAASHAASMQPLVVILRLLTVFVTAYMLSANACFYDLASGSLVVEHGDVTYDGYISDSIDTYEIQGFESEYKDNEEDWR